MDDSGTASHIERLPPIGTSNTVSNDNTVDITKSLKQNFLPLNHILIDINLGSKSELLLALAKLAKSATGYKKRVILDVLRERESVAPMVGNHGSAITAIRLVGIKKTYCFIMRLDCPIKDDFGNDIDIVFMMLAPVTASYAGAKHLPLLASVTRFMNQPENISALKASNSPKALQDELMALFQ